MNEYIKNSKWRTCWKVPEMKTRNVLDFRDDGGGEAEGEDLRDQVLKHDLFIGGLELESRRKLGFSIIIKKIEFVIHFFMEAVDLHCMEGFIVGMTANFCSISSLFLFRECVCLPKRLCAASLFCVSFYIKHCLFLEITLIWLHN